MHVRTSVSSKNKIVHRVRVGLNFNLAERLTVLSLKLRSIPVVQLGRVTNLTERSWGSAEPGNYISFTAIRIGNKYLNVQLAAS